MLHRTLHPLGLAVLGLSVALTAACDREDPGLPTAVTAVDELAASAETSDADVVLMSDGATVVGQSHLTRNQNGIRANVRTSGLTPGDVVTLWLVAFQDPDGCIDACDSPPEDLGPGRAALGLAGAQIVPSSGKVTIAGKFDVGDEAALVQFGSVDVFDTPFGSEVHLVIRAHGPVIPELLAEQMGSFNGGCPPNACVSIQVGIHQP